MRITSKWPIGSLAVLLQVVVLSQPLPVAHRPEDVGISSERLERVHRQMNADVESGRIPGAVLLIARNGGIAALDALGFQERRSHAPMTAGPAPHCERRPMLPPGDRDARRFLDGSLSGAVQFRPPL